MKRSLTPVKLFVAGLAVAAGGIATLAYAHGGPPAGAFMHPHGAMMLGSPERIDHRIDRMLDGLDASDAQRTQIKQIARAAAQDLRAQRQARRNLREQMLQAFAAPTVDANAVEALRQQQLAAQDQASRRMTTALLDVSRVLTPEQRAKFAERVKARGERMKERRERMQQRHGERPAR